jgi:hypothetical protein
MLEKILRETTLRAMIVVSLILCSPDFLIAADSSSSDSGVPTIEAKTSGMRHMFGFLPLHWDAQKAANARSVFAALGRWPELLVC